MNQGGVATANGGSVGVQIQHSPRLPDFLQSVNLKLTVYVVTRPRPVYLVDYSCYLAPDHLKASYAQFMKHSRLTGDFDESSLEFQCKILEHSGLGEETYFPKAMHDIPPTPSMATTKEEAEEVMFGALDILLKNTNVNPKDIGILEEIS